MRKEKYREDIGQQEFHSPFCQLNPAIRKKKKKCEEIIFERKR